MRFVKNPVEFDAVQWRGDNLEDLQAFCGLRIVDSVDEDRFQLEIFNPIGTALTPDNHPGATAELWVEANSATLPIETGEWVIKDDRGFYPCKDEIMKKNNTPLEDRWGSPPNFEQELVSLINKHSVENRSNTPDWILAEYMRVSLQAWDLGVRLRDDWFGATTPAPEIKGAVRPPVPQPEYHAFPRPKEERVFDTNETAVLKEPRLWQAGDVFAEGALDGNDAKTVPIVQYVDGRRNEIGEARINITPGEVRFTGTLGNIQEVTPILGQITLDKGQFSIDDTDPLSKGDR